MSLMGHLDQLPSLAKFLTLNHVILASNPKLPRACRDRADAQQLEQRRERQLFAKMNEARILRSNVIMGDREAELKRLTET